MTADIIQTLLLVVIMIVLYNIHTAIDKLNTKQSIGLETTHKIWNYLRGSFDASFSSNSEVLRKFENLRTVIIRHEREMGIKRRKRANNKLSQTKR